jgi:hypothetical protein
MKKVICALILSTIFLSCNVFKSSSDNNGDSGSGVVVDTTPPVVNSVYPAEDATGIATNIQIQVQFSEDMDLSSITADNFSVRDADNTTINGSIEYADRVAIFTPSPGLKNLETYTVEVSTGVKDKSGNFLETAKSWAFTTVASGTVPAPTFNPIAGTYSSTQNVVISCAEPGATIKYTTDESEPSPTNGTLYENPVEISVNKTLKAIAYKNGMHNSTVTSGSFVIQAAMPGFNPPAGTYNSDQSIALSTTTSDATIHYTINGDPPTTESPVYSSLIPIAGHGTIKTIRAIAVKSGMGISDVATGVFTIDYDQLAEPTISPAPENPHTGGTSVEVTISHSTPGVTIHYSTNGGSTWSSGSSPIITTVTGTNQTIEVKAYASKDGYVDSDTGSKSYIFNYGKVATPVITPDGTGMIYTGTSGSYPQSNVAIQITCGTSGATIYYTTDGSTWNSGPSPVNISLTGLNQTKTVQAYAVKSNWINSNTGSRDYQFSRYYVTGTWGSYGSGGGQFNSPCGLSYNPQYSYKVYIADSNNKRIQIIDKRYSNNFYTPIPTAPQSEGLPYDTAFCIVSGSQRLFVATAGTQNRIIRYSATGTYEYYRWDAGTANPYNINADKPLGSAQIWASLYNGTTQVRLLTGDLAGYSSFNLPYTPDGVSFDNSGNIYIVDSVNRKIEKRKYGDGSFSLITQMGSSGSGPGQLNTPRDVAVYASYDRIYVTDTGNHRIMVFDTSGNYITHWGLPGSGTGQFNAPYGITISAPHIIITDRGNHRVVAFGISGTP